jgi:hypothetical protein
VAADEARKAELRERYGLRAVDADTPGPVAARRSVTPEATKAVPATAVLPG